MTPFLASSIEASQLKETCVRFSSLSCNSSKMPSIEGSWLRSRRGNQMIVAASPPTEDAVIATEPLTKEDLVGYLVSGCKTKEKWRYRHEQLNTCITLLRYQMLGFERLCRRLLNVCVTQGELL